MVAARVASALRTSVPFSRVTPRSGDRTGMAQPNAAWGIEIGADSLKALRLERDGDSVSVSDFIVIPHKRVLSTPDVDPNDTIRITLGQFISQKSLENEHLVMSVPGHAAFARFAKLPPVEPKKVPDIVRFEAVQQIPFPIDEVEWDYQTFQSEDSPEIEVGIFAMTRDRVRQRLELYSEVGLSPETLTLSPVSVFNAMHYDLQLAKRSQPVVFIDIGTQATDVIVAEAGRCWIRTFPLGGTHFTEAIANAFKLNYAKADKLKREASTSKYAKQILQAMRPVFSDLLQDLQRSIGYYQSVHRDQELTEMIGLGSTFKIPGLRKFIGQQLQIQVGRLDEFRRISVAGREAAAFAEHAVNMATAYGLALQGIGLAPIDVNLVPVRILREQMWHSKTKWFAGAAAIFVAGSAAMLYHPVRASTQLSSGESAEVTRARQAGRTAVGELQSAVASAGVNARAVNGFQLLQNRGVWAFLLDDVSNALASANPQPELFGSDPAPIIEIPPGRRRLIELEALDTEYSYNAEQGARRFRVTASIRFTHDDPIEFVSETVTAWLAAHTDPEGTRAQVPYRIIPGSISSNHTLLDTRLTDASGREEAGEPARRPGPRVPTAPTAPAGGTAPAPGAGSGVSPGSGGIGLGGSSGRRTVGETTRAPGGSTGADPSGTGSSRRGADEPVRPPGAGDLGGAGTPWPTGDQERGRDSRSPALDQLAPIPGLRPILEEGVPVHRLPITFEIELIESRPASVPPEGEFGAFNSSGSEHLSGSSHASEDRLV